MNRPWPYGDQPEEPPAEGPYPSGERYPPGGPYPQGGSYPPGGPYPYGYGGPPGPVPRGYGRTNVFAILSLIFAFLFWPLGIIFGHIARSQIRRTGQGGAGLALAGLIISYIFLGLIVLAIVAGIGLGSSSSGSSAVVLG